MCKPNIFDYATSELSQDAVLAYMLAWADPKQAKTTKLHKLGQDFLLALLNKAGQKIDKIKDVVVKTQDNNIDISVDINEKIFMIIEDKVETIRHGDQILRYKDAATERFDGEGKTREIVAIYLKTGNESNWFHPESERASCFFRGDMLEVLDNNKDTSNSIIYEFRTHLQCWEDETQSFRANKVSEWKYSAHEGYYLYLENALKKEGEACGNYGWCYTNNPGGGFLEFWWVPERKSTENLYRFGLQIRDCKTLFIRVTEAWEKDEQIRVAPDIRWQLYEQIAQVADRFKENIKVTWSGRAGGYSATLAQVYFDENQNFLVTGQDGKVDFDASIERMRRAIRFLEDVREKVSI